MATEWQVEIVERGNPEKVIKAISCGSSERHAERVERGVNINLNHDKFFTRLASASER